MLLVIKKGIKWDHKSPCGVIKWIYRILIKNIQRDIKISMMQFISKNLAQLLRIRSQQKKLISTIFSKPSTRNQFHGIIAEIKPYKFSSTASNFNDESELK